MLLGFCCVVLSFLLLAYSVLDMYALLVCFDFYIYLKDIPQTFRYP